MSVIKINQQSYEELSRGDKPLLLDFYADWCGPCRMLSPILEEIADEREDVAVGKVNIDELPDLANAFGVYSIPTLVLIKEGKIVEQSIGFKPKEMLLALLDG